MFEASGSGFDERANLIELAPGHMGQFGATVAMAGEMLLVGDPGTDNCGAVFAFEPTSAGGWVLTETFADLDRCTAYGYALGASDQWIVVSAPLDRVRGPEVRAVHVITLALPSARRR